MCLWNMFTEEQHTCAIAPGIEQDSALSQAGEDPPSGQTRYRPPARSCLPEAEQDKKVDRN